MTGSCSEKQINGWILSFIFKVPFRTTSQEQFHLKFSENLSYEASEVSTSKNDQITNQKPLYNIFVDEEF